MRTEDDQRTDEARRAEYVALLKDHGIGTATAEALVASWEQEAAKQGLDRSSAAFRERADAWIAARRWR